MDIKITDGKVEGLEAMKGLLESSSQGSCINKALSTDALTDRHEKRNLTTMIMVDGHDSSTGSIIQHNPVKIRIAGHTEQLALNTAPLFHPIVLGMPWHKRHNPKIDSPGNTMTFDSDYCRANCSYYSTTISVHPTDPLEPQTRYSETQTPEPETQRPGIREPETQMQQEPET